MQTENDSIFLNHQDAIPYRDILPHSIHDSIDYKTNPEKIISFYQKELFENTKDTSIVTSIFQNHLLIPLNESKLSIEKNQEDWLLIPFIFVLILSIYIITNFFQRSLQALKAPFSKRGMSQLERDGSIFKETIQYPIYLIEITSISILLFQSIEHFSPALKNSYPSHEVFLLILLIYFVFIFTKTQILNLLAYIFNTSEETYVYKVVGFLLYGIGSIALLPLSFAFQYTKIDALLYISISLIISLVLFRLLKGFQIWGGTYNYFKIFVYLCTVEILPYVLIAKVILNIIK